VTEQIIKQKSAFNLSQIKNNNSKEVGSKNKKKKNKNKRNIQKDTSLAVSSEEATTTTLTTTNDPLTEMTETARTSLPPVTIRVLDIGSGSGLLGMMSARAIKKHNAIPDVVCCEKVEMLAYISIDIIETNKLDDSIRVANAYSSEVELPAIGWDNRAGQALEQSGESPVAAGSSSGKQDVSEVGADLIVTEIFGDQALSESVLVTMEHAKQHLVNKRNCVCVPAAFRVVGALALAPAWLIEQTQLSNPVDTNNSPDSGSGGGGGSTIGNDMYSETLQGLVSREVPLSVANANSLVWVTDPYVFFSMEMLSPSLKGETVVQMKKMKKTSTNVVAAAAEDDNDEEIKQSGSNECGNQPLVLVHWFELDMDETSVLTTAPISLSQDDELQRHKGKKVTRAECWKQNLQLLPHIKLGTNKPAQKYATRVKYHKDRLFFDVNEK